jgi:hypothetical protein
MENISSSVTENNTNSQECCKKSQKSLVCILLLFVFLLLGTLSYFFITEKISFVKPSEKDKDTIEDIVEDTVEENSENNKNFVTYTYNNPKMGNAFTLQYPEDWEITKNNTTCGIDPVSKTEVCTKYELVISLIENPKYYFSLNMCSECEPGFLCKYSDSNFDEQWLHSMQGGVEFQSFEEFNGGNYRRGLESSEENKLTICKLVKSQDNINYFTSSLLPSIDKVFYGLDENPDISIIETMDNIVLSIKEIPKQ